MPSTLRVALISDIHGNAIALRQALRAIEKHGVDEVICLGDVATLGVSPGEVIDLLQRLKCRCIRGNHDDYVLDAALSDDHSDTPMIRDAIGWCRDQLSREHIEHIAGFEEGLELSVGDATLKLFHGSPSSNLTNLFADTPAETLDIELGPNPARVMAGGHTHIQMLRQHRGVLVVNPGSVGAAFREYPSAGLPVILPHAEFAIVELSPEGVAVTLHRAHLDRHALAAAALASSNPMSEQLAAPFR